MLPPALRRLAPILTAAAALVLLAAAPAFGDAISPESGAGSPNADSIDTLYKIVFYIGVVIFLIVEGALIWSLVRYRARRGDPEPVQIHGNAPLEIGWTLAAATIVVVISVVTFIYLGDIKNPAPSGAATADGTQVAALDQPDPEGPGKPLRITVNGQQYLWRFDYDSEEGISEGRPVYAYYEMVVPVNRTVTLKVNASDVAHSWWIPKLGGKADAVPGHTNETWFKATKPGRYVGQCAELCGEGHADMQAAVRVVPEDEYTAWLDKQREDIQAAQDGLAEQRKAREEEED